MIAAPGSHAGKTTLTIGLLAALRRRGVRARAAKSGPDYIDPAFHEAACGAPSMNLDSWAMPAPLLDRLFNTALQSGALLIIEAAMGLFDGVAGPGGETGRAADLAARFGVPVILVLDVAGQSQSAAAVARGFMLHDPDVHIAGVILNRVGSHRHRDAIAAALAERGIEVFGAVPRDSGIRLPERHLGLVQAMEQTDSLSGYLQHLADHIEAHVDVDAVMRVAAGEVKATEGDRRIDPPGQRIAVARDRAFSFMYPHLLLGWRAAGAEIQFFSPLADEVPPAGSDVCWLPGGYPELHGPALAAADNFRAGMKVFSQTHPIHGECGGYMVLGEAIVDAAGHAHATLGLLDHVTSFASRRLHLGYRQARLLADGVLGRAGLRLRGHEFHYATITKAGTAAAFASLQDSGGCELGPAGGRRGMVSGSFFHVIA